MCDLSPVGLGLAYNRIPKLKKPGFPEYFIKPLSLSLFVRTATLLPFSLYPIYGGKTVFTAASGIEGNILLASIVYFCYLFLQWAASAFYLALHERMLTNQPSRNICIRPSLH